MVCPLLHALLNSGDKNSFVHFIANDPRSPFKGLSNILIAVVAAGITGAAAGIEQVGGAKVEGATGEAATSGANSALNNLKLSKQLASEAQMSEQGTTIAGGNSGTVFRDAERVVKEYGGSPSDWVKKSSTSYTAKDGTKFETHWVENIRTGQRVEIKTNPDSGGN